MTLLIIIGVIIFLLIRYPDLITKFEKLLQIEKSYKITDFTFNQITPGGDYEYNCRKQFSTLNYFQSVDIKNVWGVYYAVMNYNYLLRFMNSLEFWSNDKLQNLAARLPRSQEVEFLKKFGLEPIKYLF